MSQIPTQAHTPSDNILSMENITKIYANGFVANNKVNFAVRKGEIHGLVGENGAGKTTLMKVLFGQETPEEGRITLRGQEERITSPLHALEHGIGMVHQHFMLLESLSVAENMVLGHEPIKGLVFDFEEAVKKTLEVSKRFDLEVNPKALVKDLSVGYKQRVEILKMLLHGADILLLDEPTALLTPQETRELFKQLKQLREMGYSIVFISHKLNEVKEICDRITVLKSGQSVVTAEVGELTEQDISRLMVGRDISLEAQKAPAQTGEPVLSVRNLAFINKFGTYAFKNLNFDIRSGEILGVAGVEGNGQSELSSVLAGLDPIQEGSVTIKGQDIHSRGVRAIREAGVSIIHEDRMVYGASVKQSVAENILSDRYEQPVNQHYGFLDWKNIFQRTQGLIKSFAIKTQTPKSEVRTLSGGNIQKVVAAREFSAEPSLLIACQPTRGIDIGAADLIRRKMVNLRDENQTAVMLFSADMTELLNWSDSLMVLYSGEIVAYFPDASKINEEVLGEYMLGIKRQSDEEIRRAIHA